MFKDIDILTFKDNFLGNSTVIFALWHGFTLSALLYQFCKHNLFQKISDAGSQRTCWC